MFSLVGAIQCEKCVVGQWAKADKTGCDSCPSGKYGINASATSEIGGCTNCTIGKFSTAIGADSVKTCNNCAPGTYNPQNGSAASDSCRVCEEGKVSLEFGSSKCKTCAEFGRSGAPLVEKTRSVVKVAM